MQPACRREFSSPTQWRTVVDDGGDCLKLVPGQVVPLVSPQMGGADSFAPPQMPPVVMNGTNENVVIEHNRSTALLMMASSQVAWGHAAPVNATNQASMIEHLTLPLKV